MYIDLTDLLRERILEFIKKNQAINCLQESYLKQTKG